jgi:hypothetical protein
MRVQVFFRSQRKSLSLLETSCFLSFPRELFRASPRKSRAFSVIPEGRGQCIMLTAPSCDDTAPHSGNIQADLSILALATPSLAFPSRPLFPSRTTPYAVKPVLTSPQTAKMPKWRPPPPPPRGAGPAPGGGAFEGKLRESRVFMV